MEQTSGLGESLQSKLLRISDLAQKLIYIRWGQESFVLLLRAVQDLLALIRLHPQQQRTTALAERLEQQITSCLAQGELPQGAAREQLITLLDALCRMTTPDQGQISHRPIETITSPIILSQRPHADLASTAQHPDQRPLIWLISDDTALNLERRLQQRSGLQVWRCADLEQAKQHISAVAAIETPSAMLIDLDQVEMALLIAGVAELRELLGADPPVFFLSERGDITMRLAAVRADGAGYFTKPIDLPMLLETLDKCVLKPRNQRILIVDDYLPNAREIAGWLEQRGLATQVLAQPLQILPALRSFQPNLLILNLDLKNLDGLLLAQAIQQHELFRELPLILLSAQPNIAKELASSALSGETLLGNPPSLEVLGTVIAGRLRRDRGLHHKFSQLSHRDTVSGLYNRPYFLAYLERVLVASAADTQAAAVMLITLDNVRGLESQDVTAADDLIEQVAKRFQAALGADAIAARFSDAVFAALLGFTRQEVLPTTAQAVQTALEATPYVLASCSFELRTSIGISIANAGLCEAATLIQQADLACGMARESKDARIYVHRGRTSEPEEDNSQHRRLLEEVREAVQQQRMNLLFQPVVSLRGDAVERYEVFLRMRNREGWELLPETVFSLIKRHRIGMVLDRWVIAHSIRILRERQMRGEHVVLFINLSPTIVQDDGFINWLEGGISKTGIAAAALTFEITETMAELYHEAFRPFLGEIKKLGCGVSIDRFGGHERSQAIAKALSANYIKLDARFTHELANNKARQQELTRLARTFGALGIKTIVTGIEDATIMQVLWDCGIDYVQGFVLQRPHTEMSYNFDELTLS